MSAVIVRLITAKSPQENIRNSTKKKEKKGEGGGVRVCVCVVVVGGGGVDQELGHCTHTLSATTYKWLQGVCVSGICPDTVVPITDQSSWFIQFAVCSISFDRVLNIVWAAGLSNAKRPCCRFDRHTVGFQILTFRDCFSDQSPGLEERASERERERERNKIVDICGSSAE